jgi:hypothetical protein
MRKFMWPGLLVLAACAVPPREPPPAVPPEPAEARPAPPAGPAESWKVVASHLEVRVYRDGPMQKLGHNHLITSGGLVGEIALRQPLERSGFELSLPLESLVVDDEAARAAAGGEFAAPVPEKDREATRRNMLGEKLLDAASQEMVRLSADSLSAGPDGYEAQLRVALAGHERVVEAPFTVSIEGDRLEARAAFKLTHAALGLAPYNVALGSLKVREDFDVELTLEARRGT